MCPFLSSNKMLFGLHGSRLFMPGKIFFSGAKLFNVALLDCLYADENITPT